MAFEIHVSAFANGTTIPAKYTADGKEVSPKLDWSGTPEGAKALVLIMDDPDAPRGLWVHWLVYDLPADTQTLPEGVGKGATLPAGAKEGINSWNRSGYGGPSPPPGKPHRYYFKLYALSAPTGLNAGVTKAELEAAIKDKTLGMAQWMGTYGR
jgi:Raf kinase inhibitor-like YbhB/YbcL family protein